MIFSIIWPIVYGWKRIARLIVDSRWGRVLKGNIARVSHIDEEVGLEKKSYIA